MLVERSLELAPAEVPRGVVLYLWTQGDRGGAAPDADHVTAGTRARRDRRVDRHVRASPLLGYIALRRCSRYAYIASILADHVSAATVIATPDTAEADTVISDDASVCWSCCLAGGAGCWLTDEAPWWGGSG